MERKNNTHVVGESTTSKASSSRNSVSKSGRKKTGLLKSNKAHGVPIAAIGMFICLFLVSIFMLFQYSKGSTDAIIVQDVQRLQVVFDSIHKECQIQSFVHTKNYIDFLTVSDFVGSDIGSMTVRYPKNWQGPYMQQTPTIQGKQYMILNSKGGFYIVPGDGVVLGNGKKIGVDIILDEKSDMNKLLQDENGLKSGQGALAASLAINSGFFQKMLQIKQDVVV